MGGTNWWAGGDQLAGLDRHREQPRNAQEELVALTDEDEFAIMIASTSAAAIFGGFR